MKNEIASTSASSKLAHLSASEIAQWLKDFPQWKNSDLGLAMAAELTARKGVTVTDREGNSHVVIAAKRKDSYRVTVLREWHSLSSPYVVHTFNESDGGFHHGHYCATLERAQEVFDAK